MTMVAQQKRLLSYDEEAALSFLSKVEHDHIAEIGDENVLCAALVYAGLSGRGYVAIERTSAGPLIRITPAGRAAIARAGEDGGDHDR